VVELELLECFCRMGCNIIILTVDDVNKASEIILFALDRGLEVTIRRSNDRYQITLSKAR